MKIKKWARVFGTSFFSNKAAGEAPKFGFVGVFLSLLLAVLCVTYGYFGATVVPFSMHYGHAGQYQAFIHSAFESGVELSVENHRGKSNGIINTYTDDEDRAAYGKNGYNLIVDTRPSDTLIVFEQAAFKGDEKLSYEEYLALPDEAKKEYELAVGYTDELLEITADMAQKYTAYLEEISREASDNYKKEAAEDYGKLKAGKESYTEEAYGKELYYLYVKYYYPNVASMYGAKAPVLRDYYYANFIAAGNAYYFYVFDNMCAGSFKTDKGIPVVFGGYFDKCADGKVADIDELIQQTYYDTAGHTFLSYLVSGITQLPMLLLIPLILGFLMWGVGKGMEDGWEKTFSGCYKIVHSFVWMSALLTALAVFAGGFLTAAQAMYRYIPAIYGGILLIRAAVFCILSAMKK